MQLNFDLISSGRSFYFLINPILGLKIHIDPKVLEIRIVFFQFNQVVPVVPEAKFQHTFSFF